MLSIQVLAELNLETSGRTLTRDDGRVSQKVLPDSVPLLTVLRHNLFLVGSPVAVPSPQGSRVVDTNGINVDDFKTSALELVHDPSQGSRGIGTGENVLVHEQTPDQVLVLPRLSQSSVLKEENTIVIKHIVHLVEELAKLSHSYVLSHLQAGNLVVLSSLGHGSVTVVEAQNSGLRLGDSILAEVAVTPGGLVATQGDSSYVRLVLTRSESGKSSPTTSEVQDLVAWLESNLFAHYTQLVVLELLQSLLAVNVRDESRGVDHSGAQEPRVKVVTTVIVVSDLLLVLGSRVQDDLRKHSGQEELEQRKSETEAGPVVSVLHGIQTIALEGHLSIKEELVESLHWDLVVTAVLFGELGRVELEVVFHSAVGEFNFFIQTRRVGRSHGPESHENGDNKDQEEQHKTLESSSNLPGNVTGDT